MSKHINNHLQDTKLPLSHLKQITYSVDVKRFSRDRGLITPNQNTSHIYRKLQQKSNQKIRNTQPTYLNGSFSKNISQKNMQTKRKLSSGFQLIKNNHHSVSVDHHLIKQKYQLIKDYFQKDKYDKVVPLARQSLAHFEHSNSQKNVYYWLAGSLGHLKRYDQAIQDISQCLQTYPNFVQGYLLLGQLHNKIKNYKLAVESLRQAIKINPNCQEAYIQLSTCYSAMKSPTKQKQCLKQAIDNFPKQPIFLMLFVQCLLTLKEVNRYQAWIKKMQKIYGRKDSIYLYVLGLLQKSKDNQQQAYILFDQSLKYNNNRLAVNKSLMQSIKIQIDRRDFYQAHHSITRIKYLQLQQSNEMRLYAIFIEGAMTMMKKKSEEAINILVQIVNQKQQYEGNLLTLTYKYLGYGYFKVGNYEKSIKYYQKIKKEELDESSQYNQLLAQGIILADQQHDFGLAYAKFQNAKKVYPLKVEPYLYRAMLHIMKYHLGKVKDQVKKAQVLIQALKEMEQAYHLNSNSSNMLYHRTIIHLYFEDWEQALNDINRCIEKAQENLPKYFYLRGVCYSCIKQYKKAINQFSIALSLDVDYQLAHFQKAKCYFLLGNTQKGFSSLKSFIELNPEDLSIYRWIGNLLYQGKSYFDALKSYSEYDRSQELQTTIMKIKCEFRVGALTDVSTLLKIAQKYTTIDKQKIHQDMVCLSLLTSLIKNQSSKILINSVHKLNKMLEQNKLGYIFELIDCMNLLGVASFYLGKYRDAYQSFLLVLELFQSLSQKQSIMIKSQECQEDLDIRLEDVYFNIVISNLARGHKYQVKQMIDKQFIGIISEFKQKKKGHQLSAMLEKSAPNQIVDWDFKNDRPVNSKLKLVVIEIGKLKLRTKPVFNLYHHSSGDLDASEVADKMIKQLHVGYIDKMPQGPWIKRNPFGVVFTQEMMVDNSVSLGDTFRNSSSKMQEDQQSFLDDSVVEQKKTISKKDEFLRRLQFDKEVEDKLNRVIKGANK